MGSRRLNSLAVVVPCYNEELTIPIFYQTVCNVLDALPLTYQFIFVDDGSTDKTLALLNELADKDSRVSVLSFARNFGHQLALTAGLDHADAEAVIMMDSDLQHPPEVIPSMINAYEGGLEVVYAIRENEEFRGFIKRLTARTFYQLMQRMTNVPVIPGAADFRLMSRQSLLVLREMREVHRYLRGMIPWMGFAYGVVTYPARDRYAGETKYTFAKMFRLARHGLFSFSTLPLAVITWIGLFSTLLALIYLVYVFVITVIIREPTLVPGWASVIGVLLIVSSIQFVALGVLSQYIGMIFEEIKQRPLYILKQKRLPSHTEQDT